MKKLLILVFVIGVVSASAEVIPDRTVIIGHINEVTRLPLRKGTFVRGRVVDFREDLQPEELHGARRIAVRLPKSCHDLAMKALMGKKRIMLLVSGHVIEGEVPYNIGLLRPSPRASLQFDYQKNSKTTCELVTWK